MTTVINLNFLNFFRLNQDNQNTFNDISVNNQLADRRQEDPPERERIIDVTPYNRLAVNDEKDLRPVVTSNQQTKLVIPHDLIARTYDRRGNSVDYAFHKGLNIDSYV